MVLPRPSVLRGFAPSRVLRSAPRTANRAVARRGYASGHGAHPEPSSDVPWAVGSVAVTVPLCYYLWPSASHAEAHHGDHAETSEHRAEAQTHPSDHEAPVETEEKETPESKGDTDDVQFKGKTADGDEDNKQDDTRKVEDDSKGGKKLRIDSASAVDLGAGAEKRDDGSDSAATNKEGSSDSGDISKKQQGISSTATKHSTDITNDSEKSKKAEGTPETAKAQGTVSVNRPAVEDSKTEETQENNPNPEAAKEKAGDKPEEKEEKSEEKSEDKKDEKKDE